MAIIVQYASSHKAFKASPGSVSLRLYTLMSRQALGYFVH
jgi:hypothetical protein